MNIIIDLDDYKKEGSFLKIIEVNKVGNEFVKAY